MELNDSESALISCIIMQPEKAFAKMPDLAETDFQISACRHIFRAIKDLRKLNREIVPETLWNYILTIGLEHHVGGVEMFTRIVFSVSSPVLMMEYYRDVVENSVRARVTAMSLIPPKDINISNWLNSLSAQISEQQLRLMGLDKRDEINGGDAVFEAIDKLDEYSTGEKNVPRLGIYEIDKVTRGFEPGEMWVFAGPTKSGKSMLGVQVLCHWVIDQKGSAYVASLEMSSTQYAMRCIAHESQIDLERVATKLATPSEFERIANATAKVQDAFKRVTFLQRRDTTVEGLASRVMALEKKPELLIVDYIQLMRASDPKQERHQQVAHISTRLKELAERAKVAVVALSQLNEDGKTRESRVIEHDCDGLIRIEEIRDDHAHIWLNLDLHRDGKNTKVYCDAKRSVSTFSASKDDPPEPTGRRRSF